MPKTIFDIGDRVRLRTRVDKNDRRFIKLNPNIGHVRGKINGIHITEGSTTYRMKWDTAEYGANWFLGKDLVKIVD